MFLQTTVDIARRRAQRRARSSAHRARPARGGALLPLWLLLAPVLGIGALAAAACLGQGG